MHQTDVAVERTVVFVTTFGFLVTVIISFLMLSFSYY